MPRFILGGIECHCRDVARLIFLRAGGLHLLRQPAHHLPDEIPSDSHHTFARAKVLLEPNLRHAGIAVFEAQDVTDVAAAPLIDRLVVVAYDADARAQAVHLLDHGFLHRIYVLILVDNDLADAGRQPFAQARVALELGYRLLEDSGIVQVPRSFSSPSYRGS
jgi:hypothetical protein